MLSLNSVLLMCYLAAPRPTFGHSPRDNFIKPMFIIEIFDPKVIKNLAIQD